MLLQTRRGSLVQDRFPDLVAAAAGQLPDGLVLDGELLVWDQEAGQLSFEGLQRRAAARSRSAHLLAAALPAYYVAFDLLQQDGRASALPRRGQGVDQGQTPGYHRSPHRRGHRQPHPPSAPHPGPPRRHRPPAHHRPHRPTAAPRHGPSGR
ncbi:ATP-dependent DNA ligase [Streptomyces xanthochromogenes]|uniref:ATP-dependent DNA ligase n=1 Tax=Streptomyces xanthochromogenes TaxID=67384 RepID=UPI0034311309